MSCSPCERVRPAEGRHPSTSHSARHLTHPREWSAHGGDRSNHCLWTAVSTHRAISTFRSHLQPIFAVSAVSDPRARLVVAPAFGVVIPNGGRATLCRSVPAQSMIVALGQPFTRLSSSTTSTSTVLASVIPKLPRPCTFPDPRRRTPRVRRAGSWVHNTARGGRPRRSTLRPPTS
jgi:hypothetical protein